MTAEGRSIGIFHCVHVCVRADTHTLTHTRTLRRAEAAFGNPFKESMSGPNVRKNVVNYSEFIMVSNFWMAPGADFWSADRKYKSV